jgi:hypothetical protein
MKPLLNNNLNIHLKWILVMFKNSHNRTYMILTNNNKHDNIYNKIAIMNAIKIKALTNINFHISILKCISKLQIQ